MLNVTKLVVYSKIKPNINLEDMNRMNKKFIEMIDKDAKIGYVASVIEPSRKHFRKTEEFYKNLGISSILYFDLEEEYKEENEDWLYNCDVIHLSSGNTYTFLKNLKRRNMLEKLREYSNKGGILVGVSAGAHILSKTISCAQFGDENLVNLTNLNALGLVKFQIIPHWNKKKKRLQDIKIYSKNHGILVYTLEDGQGIIIDNNNICYFGNIGCIKEGRYSCNL